MGYNNTVKQHSNEIVDTNLEKLFFSYTMENPDQFYKVEPSFFKNDQISFVFNIIRDEYLKSKDKIVPSPKQILAMVQLHDNEQSISKETLKILLKSNTEDVQKDWLEPRFKAWKMSNKSKSSVLIAIDKLREIQDINYDNVKEVTNQIKNLFDDIQSIDDDDDDLGEDFDDAESHKQYLSLNKISTGFKSVDTLIGGGWDLSTLNVLVAETSNGKCTCHDTEIKIKNKKTGIVEMIKIGDFYNILKNK